MSATKQPQIAIVGSINMDLVVRVERLPRAGETIHGNQLLQIPGGKGANQAVAVAQLGGRARMIGRVGDDGFGPTLVSALESHQVDTAFVTTTTGCSSGVAVISVEQSGENSITIIGGANQRLTGEDVTDCEQAIAGADVLLVQLETPVDTVARAIELARAHGVTTILDPAPAPTKPLPDMLQQVDVFSPNQTEAEVLTGVSVQTPQNAEQAAAILHAGGARHVVMKLGEMGALVYQGPGNVELIPTRQVSVVDTTAAGDAFTAGLAIGYALGWPPADATRFGCAAGTLATTKLGAQQSMPTRQEVDRFM